MKDAVDVGADRRLQLAAVVMRIDEFDTVPLQGINRSGEAARRTDDERFAADEAGQLGVATDDRRLRTDRSG